MGQVASDVVVTRRRVAGGARYVYGAHSRRRADKAGAQADGSTPTGP